MKKAKSKLIRPTRRQVLGMLSSSALAPLARSPLAMLISSLTDGLLMKHQAQAAGIQAPPRNYVFINSGGGIARWVWDMPLIPYQVESLIPCAHVKTRFRTTTEAEYATAAITRQGVTLNMPTLWNVSIPTSSGGTVPMNHLLDHMLMIRGVRLPSDGHANNHYRQTRPVESVPSIDGAVADRSSNVIPAVGLRGGNLSAYKSGLGISLSKETDPSRYSSLFSPFNSSGDGVAQAFRDKNLSLDSGINLALADLSNEASLTLPDAGSLFNMRKEAQALLRKGLGNFATEYPARVNTYTQLIDRVIASPIPGVTDIDINVAGLRKNTGGLVPHTIAGEMFLGNNADIRKLINANTRIGNMAENFAIAEYLLVNGFSTAINMGLGSGVTGLHLTDAYKTVYNENYDLYGVGEFRGDVLNGEWAHDEHVGGSFISLIVNSFLFRALSACLYEFIGAIGPELFKETVIQVGGEFSRSARDDNMGSDHGWVAQTNSIFCGAIPKPMVLGNTYLKAVNSGGGSPTSWGVAAPVTVGGVSQELNIGHLTSTVSYLLRVAPPLPNNPSIVTETSTGVAPSIELAKNINNR